MNIARSTGSEAVAPPIIGFSIATCHYYDAEVVGPLKRPLKDTFKKARSLLHQNTAPPRRLRTVSVLSQISPLVSLQNKTKEGPATSPCSHHDATERVEESAPICPAASSNRALPTPSRLSEYFPYLSVTWGRKNRVHADGVHDTGSDTMGWTMSPHANGGPRLGAAVFFFFSQKLPMVFCAAVIQHLGSRRQTGMSDSYTDFMWTQQLAHQSSLPRFCVVVFSVCSLDCISEV